MKGTSLVEALLALFVICSLGFGVFATSYMYFLKIWTEYQGHRALLCALERGHAAEFCAERYHRLTLRFLPRGVEHKGEVYRLGSCSYFRSFTRARLRWRWQGPVHYQVWRKDWRKCLGKPALSVWP